MEEEKRLDNLQDEIKLLKGELKNSLASVRDYLLNMELPSSEFSTILAALSGDSAGPQKMSSDADLAKDSLEPDFDTQPDDELTEQDDQPAEDENLLDFEEPGAEEATNGELPTENALEDLGSEGQTEPQEEEVTEEIPEEEEQAEDLLPEDELLEEIEEEEISEEEDELPLDENLDEGDHAGSDAVQGIPKVNMIANLISWVARAKQDIGYEDLPSFLEVYGISGHLSPELKDVILRLAEIAKDLPDNAANSGAWSQSMLSLHGILTGGDAPRHPVIPSWVDINDATDSLLEEEIIEIDKDKDKSAKLKLVLPDENGNDKEFCINLAPDENSKSKSNGHSNGNGKSKI